MIFVFNALIGTLFAAKIFTRIPLGIFDHSFVSKDLFMPNILIMVLISKIEDAIQKRMFNPMQGNTASLRAYRPTRYILNIFKI